MKSLQAKEAAARRSECVSNVGRARNDLLLLEEKAGMRPQQKIVGFLDREIRDLYFACESTDLRKQLMTLHRSWVTLSNDQMDAVIADNGARVEEARRYGRLKEEIVPLAIGLFAVWIGNSQYGVVGAVAGALVGVFVGLSYVRKTAAERDFEIQVAESDLEDAIKTKREDHPYPHRFTEDEARTGVRDRNFDVIFAAPTYD